MSTFAVIGGTGTVGRHVVAALEGDGAEVRVLTRHSQAYPVDVSTGAGLDAALAGCDVVVDAGNASSRRPEAGLVGGTRHVLDAGERAGVGHLVTVSIVGIEQLPMGYYQAKLQQEQLVKDGALPWSIVRSTQFHELVNSVLGSMGRWRLSPRARIRLQPVAAREAAQVVVAVARAEPRNATVTVAGPEIQNLTSLARTWSQVRHRRGLALPIPVPRRIRRPLTAGALTCPDADERGTTLFGDWLATEERS
jgi:uncharacterized protein YbjT (DUF2867 family)